jgi:hypothetical protein
MSKIKKLVFHCSDSPFGDVDLIRKWHVEGNGWRDIGYNLVILNGHLKNSKDYLSSHDGRIDEGRGLDLNKTIDSDEQGAHAKGFNKEAIGVCLIGRDTFSVQQFESALILAKMFKKLIPSIEILGHYELSTAGGKTCPNFNMGEFRELIDFKTSERFPIREMMNDSLKKL